MYAVIRAGGKQYRVSPGDVLRVEKQSGANNALEFELLAVADNGKLGRPEGESRVTAEILGEGRAPKILVFHYKRKKQYKKLRGHRQPFTSVRIAEISFDGQTFRAEDTPPAQATKSSHSADMEHPVEVSTAGETAAATEEDIHGA